VWTTLIERGELQVVQADQAQLYLATLHAGDVFGEGAFLTNEPRSATVSARTDVQLLKLPARYLTHIIKKYPHVGTLLKQYHQQRVATTLKLIQSSS
jgi:CRP-like cAMP-binding protein